MPYCATPTCFNRIDSVEYFSCKECRDEKAKKDAKPEITSVSLKTCSRCYGVHPIPDGRSICEECQEANQQFNTKSSTLDVKSNDDGMQTLTTETGETFVIPWGGNITINTEKRKYEKVQPQPKKERKMIKVLVGVALSAIVSTGLLGVGYKQHLEDFHKQEVTKRYLEAKKAELERLREQLESMGEQTDE